ncbi:hypothetical protein KI387_028439 [Taxus chinensis]|uniref:TcdA/TcdB toxin pore forming domain-containing protein n=1 Tax=Taxus chinensis TaxID=29808 RepID=A0AA38FCP1_TAXCH|nr:hypothetical protein KI387_028439 [Taxus chinensis]
MILPFATLRHDRGFDVIRRLEEDERFDYDFYVFPSEYIIRKIKLEFVETKIGVVLDKRALRLQMYPQFHKELHGYIIYEVEGTGGEYCIGLGTGSSLSLKTSGEDAKNTTWIIDGSTLGDASIKVGKDLVNVGGITIHVLNQEFSRLLIISPGGEVSLVDFASQQALIQSEDASKWTDNNETIQQHLQKLVRENRVPAQFVVVNNYIAEHDGQQRQVGRAYYDVSRDRMLYTDVEVDIGCEFMEVPLGSNGHLGEDHPTGRLYTKVDADQDAVTSQAAFLGAVAGNDAYFFNTQSKALWLVNAETHRITTKYYTSTQFEDSDITMTAISQHADFIYMAISPINQADKGVEEIVYLIHKDTMVLSSVIGNQDLISRINGKESISLTNLVGGRDMSGTMIIFEKLAGQTLVLPSNAQFVTVLCKNESDDNRFRCWLRTSDDALIQANVKQAPNDLILTPSSLKAEGKEVFYFYSIKEEMVYCQHGRGHDNDSQAKQIKVPGLTNLFSVHGEVFTTTNAGRISRLLVDGSSYVEAVNDHWLAQHPKWWLDLASLDGKKATSITVLGVHDTKNQVVPIWYQDGKIIIASSKLHGKQLQFFGLYGDDQWALLLDVESGLLYRQPLTSNGVIDGMINSKGKLIKDGPEAKAMLGGEQIKEPAIMDGNLRVTIESGVNLVLSAYSGMATLVAVEKSWQSNSHDLIADLEILAKNWSHTDVVALQGSSDEAMPAWYYFQSQEIVVAKDLKWSDHPRWIGKSIDGSAFYIYAKDTLYVINMERGAMTEKGKFTEANVQGNSLVLHTTIPNAEINIPTLVNVKFCVVSATNAKVVIDAENWKQYQAITIHNKMEGSGEQTVDIEYSGENMLIKKMGNDIVLADGIKSGYVNLVNVLAEEDEQGSYKVNVGLGIDKEELIIFSFREYLEKLHPLLNDATFTFVEIIKDIKEESPQ